MISSFLVELALCSIYHLEFCLWSTCHGASMFSFTIFLLLIFSFVHSLIWFHKYQTRPSSRRSSASSILFNPPHFHHLLLRHHQTSSPTHANHIRFFYCTRAIIDSSIVQRTLCCLDKMVDYLYWKKFSLNFASPDFCVCVCVYFQRWLPSRNGNTHMHWSPSMQHIIKRRNKVSVTQKKALRSQLEDLLFSSPSSLSGMFGTPIHPIHIDHINHNRITTISL